MSDFINQKERMDVKFVIRKAQQWGYGNLIDRLKVAWALHLYEKDGLDLETSFIQSGLRLERLVYKDEDAFVESMRKYIGE